MGLFITFEGTEGSGKSTIIKNLADILAKEGYDLILSREPGGSKIAEQIRSTILDVNNTQMDKKTEALLYAAARSQHLHDVILPAIKENKLVLCDRYIDSSIAYQGYARDINIKDIKDINEFGTAGLLPHLTILFDLDPKIGLARIAKDQKREINRLDLEQLEFHQKVRAGYLKIAKHDKKRVAIVDASLDIQTITDKCLALIREKIKKWK
jgi:dTMP kinase